MRKQWVLAAVISALGLLAGGAAVIRPSQRPPSGLVFVKGGTFKDTTSNYYGRNVTLSSFYIGRYEITQKQWIAVMGTNPSKFVGADLPVEMVTWYDCIEYCNRRSRKEGLMPYYNIDKTRKDPDNRPDPEFGNLDTVQWTVTINPNANGYRLPTEAEWEYAAEGGQLSRNYTYSGSNRINDVAWYWRNSGERELNGFWSWSAIEKNHDRPMPVGSKKPNELGLYDMSGNVREWCWDWLGPLPRDAKDPVGSPSGYRRVWRGGGWMGAAFTDKVSFRGGLAANGTGPDQGFRVCRSKEVESKPSGMPKGLRSSPRRSGS